MRLDHYVALGIVLGSMALGATLCWLVMRKPAPVPIVETYAKPIDHGDGSSTMARVVDKQPETKAPTTDGNKVIATTEVVVKPLPPVNGDCLPVTVRVDLTESKDGALRAHERVEGGETLEAVHYAPPVRYVYAERKWGFGIANMNGDTAAVVERYWPGARFGVVVGEEYQGAEMVFRF